MLGIPGLHGAVQHGDEDVVDRRIRGPVHQRRRRLADIEDAKDEPETTTVGAPDCGDAAGLFERLVQSSQQFQLPCPLLTAGPGRQK